MRRLLLAVLLGAAAPAARAAAVAWTGGAVGDWHQASNWDGGLVPGPADTVLIASGSVIAYSTNPAIAVSALTVGQTTPVGVLMLSTGLAVSGALNLAAGGAIQVSTGGIAIAAGDIVLPSGTSVTFTVSPSSGIQAPAMRLFASGSITVAGGAVVNANSRGYAAGVGAAPGSGPQGGGAGSAGAGGGGGAHAGAGGAGGGGSSAGAAYDLGFLPLDAGSGAGGGPGADGGAGGGWIELRASTVTVDGLLDADGASGVSLGFQGGGGGAGGTILIEAAVVRGTGSIVARGGAGGAGASFGGGGGGGGRVWVRSTHYETLTSTLTVLVGGGVFGAGATFGVSGSAGSVFFDPLHWTGRAGDALASSAQNWSVNLAPAGAQRLVFGASETAKGCLWDLSGVVPSSASILASFSTTVVLASSWTVAGPFEMRGGTITASANLRLTLSSSAYQTGGRINLSGSTLAVAGAGGNQAAEFVYATPRILMVGAAAATATLSGFVESSSPVFVSPGSHLRLATGTLRLNGDGPVTGGGTVWASTGHMTYAAGATTQTWTSFPGALGTLRGGNSNGGLRFSTAAGSSFALTGGFTLDPAAVFSATGAAVSLGGNWDVRGVATLGLSTVTFAPLGATATVVAGASFDNLTFAGDGTSVVRLATGTLVASTGTVASGWLDLAAATLTVRGSWTQTGGLVTGGTSRVLFDGTGAQLASQTAGSSFGVLVASSAVSLRVSGSAAALWGVEWRRGFLDISSAALAVGGDFAAVGGFGLTATGSTTTFNGSSTQAITVPNLDSVVVANSTGGVLLGVNFAAGAFRILPGAVFDGTDRALTISGGRWDTAGADYRHTAGGHQVTWQPPVALTVSTGSIVNGRLILAVGKTAELEGDLFVGGSGSGFDPRQGSTVVNAPGGSTIVFRGSADLTPSSGANWFYAGDADNSWLVFEGTGTARGASLSTTTFGGVRVALASVAEVFRLPTMNMSGDFVLQQGAVRPNGSRILSLGGDLLQDGGDLDFATIATGTVRLTGGSTQTVRLTATHSLWHLVDEGTGPVVAAAPLFVKGDFSVTAGTFSAGSSTHAFQGRFESGPGGAFDGGTSTVTLDGAAGGRTHQFVSVSTGAFHGLRVLVSSVTLLSSVTAQVLTDDLAGSTITVAAGRTLRATDLRLIAASGASFRLRSSTAAASWFLSVVSVSSVTRAFVTDSDATGGIEIKADDGWSTDGGGNAGWDFSPTLLVLTPGETLTPGVAPGKSGAPGTVYAGDAITVTVRAMSSRHDPVTATTATVTLTSNDPGATIPAPKALLAGTTQFTVTVRRAEPSPHQTIFTATAAFASGVSTAPVSPAVLTRLQVLLPGETANPGVAPGKLGLPSARVTGIGFTATVRAVDSFWNLVSTVTDTAALTVTAPSATLPAPAALVAGQRGFTGVVIHSTGLFTLAATDTTNGAVQSGTSAVFGVSFPSLSTPTAGVYAADGARLATLGGLIAGTALDDSSVESVLVDLYDLDSASHFDWGAQSFSLGAPFFASATLAAPLSGWTTWYRAATDAAFVDGRRYRVTALADNPTGLRGVATSTFTFDRSMLSFGAKDGQGTAAVLPAATAGCEEIVSTITYTVGASGIGPGGALALRVPPGWTLPLGATNQYPPPSGYWHAASTSLAATLGSTTAVAGAPFSGPVALGPGWLLFSVAANSAQSYLNGQRIVFTYRGRPPLGPSGRGAQAFSVLARGDATGTLLSIATAPVMTLSAGTTSYLAFTDLSPLTLTPLTQSASLYLTVTDLCGNPKPGISSGTASLSLWALKNGGAVPETGALFRNASGLAISTIGFSTGIAQTNAFTVTTATDAPAELVLRATASIESGFLPNSIVEAVRPARLRAAAPAFTGVSADTGTLAVGATSAALSAADPIASVARLRFTLADPEAAWELVLSTDGANFGGPVLTAAGMGDASAPIVVTWDGVDRRQSPPGYAAAGRYKARLRAGGGAAEDRSLEVVVPPTAGYIARFGARGAGARVRAAGAGAGGDRWAVASSTGYFDLRGLKAGTPYLLEVSTDAAEGGRVTRLSTAIAAPAATAPPADLGTLSLPATAQIRVAAVSPVPSPRDALGAFVGRYADGSAAFTGVLRLSSGAASSDDGGPLFGRSASTWSVAAAPPGTYAVDLEFPDLSLSTRVAGVVVPAAGRVDLVVPLARKANLYGFAILPATAPYGAWISVQATRAGRTTPEYFGGAFVSSTPWAGGPSSGAYALYGLEAGSWTVAASAPGYLAASSAVVVVGDADFGALGRPGGVDLTLGLGGRVSGSVSVTGDSRRVTACFPAAGGAPGACPANTFELEVEALAEGRLDRVSARVRLGAHASFSSAAFALGGLDAGSWTLRAAVPGFQLSPSSGVSVAIASAGVYAAALPLTAAAARLRVEALVPPLAGGACRSTASYRSLGLRLEPEGGTPLMFADATAMAPTPGASRVQSSTATGAFVILHCSSATLFTPALAPGPVRAVAAFSGSGAIARGRALLAHGATAALTLDLSGSTYSLTGALTLSGQVAFSTPSNGVVAVSSVAGVLSRAPSVSFCLLGSGDPVTLPALRAELLPYDPVPAPLMRAPGGAGSCAEVAASTGTASAARATGFSPDGRFDFGGVLPGLYWLRVPGELNESAADGPEMTESLSLVSVGTGPASAAVTLAKGRRVAGRVAAPPGLAAGRALRVLLRGEDGTEVARADLAAGQSGVSYAFEGVPEGRYRVWVEDLGSPRAWTARPVEAVVGAGDAEGRDLVLEPAATVRARLSLARFAAGGVEEHLIVTRENAHLLPRSFTAVARAVPAAAGGVVAARTGADGSVLDAEGRLVIDGLPAGTYEIEFSAPGGADAPGSVSPSPARVSGLTLEPGQAADLGVVALFAGAWAAGRVTDAATGLPVAGARVVARPSLRAAARLDGRRDGPTALTDSDGRYLLRGLDPSVRWYDLTAAPRGAGEHGEALAPYEPRRASSVDLSSGATRDFVLSPAPATLYGRVAAADGSALFSDLGPAGGEGPGAALFLQKAATTPDEDPLADLSWRTGPDGAFAVPALATGSYTLFVTAAGRGGLSRAVTITSAALDLGTLTLGSGGTLSGALRLPDGAAVPDDEARGVAAVTTDSSEYLPGSVERDPVSGAAIRYRVAGLSANKTYRLLVLSAGDEAVVPDEGAAVTLASASESRALDLTVRPAPPTVTARSRQAGARVTVDFLFSRPLRARYPEDDELERLVSTASAAGTVSNRRLSADRRVLSLDYAPGVGESSFTLRATAFTQSVDYSSAAAGARELTVSATAAFFTGESGAHRAAISNALGGTLVIEGDEGRLTLPRGAFLVDASSSVALVLRRSPAALAGAASAGLRAAAAALPAGVTARSDFYEIELPAGVPTTLARPARLTVVYSTAADPSALNLYWYNPGTGQYVLQPDAQGGTPRRDSTARSFTQAIGHFSTFVLLDASVAAIGGEGHGGELDAYNFPNPFDLQVKTVTTIHGGGAQTVRGTMIRVAVPPGLTGQGRIRIFDATGRLLRTLDMGLLAGGQNYYQGWDGRNDAGRDAASGLYIGLVEIGGRRKSFKMAVLK